MTTKTKAKAKPKRKMPPLGYYVGQGQIIFTTGMRGGGGHKYWRFGGRDENATIENKETWATLLWSCVPNMTELQNNYVRVDTVEEAIDIFNGPEDDSEIEDRED